MKINSSLIAFALQRSRWWLLAALAVLLAIGLIGWQWHDKHYPSWDEEVQLADGRVITINQKREYYGDYGTNQSWVTITLPELEGKRVWHSYLIPMHVDVSKGQVYVFGRPRGPRQVQFYRYPKNNMVAFKWAGSEFVRIPFMDVPESVRAEENILSCLPPDHKKLVTLKQKSAQWCEPSGDKGQFVKHIDLDAYRELANAYARLDGGKPISE
jgi:hypothetical protein